jgi:SAM-dependent methyltransferase
MSWRKYLLIPQLTLYSVRAPRDQAAAWERFWSGVRRTGLAGEVLWDAASEEELARVVDRLRQVADPGLPLVDLGCGNGRQALALRGLAPRVLGLDRSASAVDRAREEARALGEDTSTVEFRVADIAAPGLGQRLHDELGDANVHVRGVLHVVPPTRRPDVVRTIEALLGGRGTAYVSETDQAGDPLETLERQGATATALPAPVRRLIAAGVRPPTHFGSAQVAEHFPPERFRVLSQGPVTMYGIPLRPGGPVHEIPGYHAVVRRVG